MKSLKALSLVLLAALVAYLLAWPIPLEPRVWQPSPHPGLVAEFAPNTALQKATRLPLPPGADGPEDVALLPDGVYTADVNGGLFRLVDTTFEKAADVGGRPLGLDEGPDGALYIADSYRGILRWTAAAGVELLADEIQGEPIIYPNQVVAASDGTIYFSNSTDRFDPAELGGTKPTSVMTIVEQSDTGYVARIDPDGFVEKIVEGLVYTNGVTLSADEDFLLINETGRFRTHRHWLEGPRAGQTEVFLDNLPGFPDNIELSPQGTFWIAFASPRTPIEKLMPHPFLRAMLWRLGPAVRPKPATHGFVAEYSAQGELIRQLQDPDGQLGITSGARQIGDFLYIGLLEGGYAARLSLGEG